MSQFIKEISISENKYQNIHNLQDKTGCKNYNFSVPAITRLMPAYLSIFIIIKSIKANIKVF